MNNRDYVYYDYIFNKIKPRNKIMLIYFKIRKILSFGVESPSKIMIWVRSKYV